MVSVTDTIFPPSRESICIARYDLTAGSGGELGQDVDTNGLAQEAHRSVAEGHIYAAGVEAVDRAGAIDAVVRIRVDRSCVLAVGGIDAVRTREDRPVGAGADQGNLASRPGQAPPLTCGVGGSPTAWRPRYS